VPLIFSIKEWQDYREASGTVIGKIARQSWLFLIGSEDDLPEVSARKWR
jgi:hypothetical protein